MASHRLLTALSGGLLIYFAGTGFVLGQTPKDSPAPSSDKLPPPRVIIDAGEALPARLGVADHDREVQRQVGDIRKRVGGVLMSRIR